MRALALAMCLATLAGCAEVGTRHQSVSERTAQFEAAAAAVKVGNYDAAERLMADYMYRDKEGGLRFKRVILTSETRKQAIDTVAYLLWETGRDASLEKFAKRYLHSPEREVMLCRLAERNAVLEQAYQCWNDLGEEDRARRVIRTEAALRILKD